MRRIYSNLFMVLVFGLLAAACSQVASGSADDDEADALSSESNENRSSSSFSELSSSNQSSSSEEIVAYSSSSGFYFADVEWTFTEWEYDSLYRSDFFTSAKYMEPLDNQLKITENQFFLLGVNKFYTSADKGGFYLKKNNSSSGYVVSFDKPKEKCLLLGVVMAHFDYVEGEYVGPNYNVNRVVEPIEKNGRLFYPLD